MKQIREFYSTIETIINKGIKIGEESSANFNLTAKKISLILNSGHSPYIAHIDADGTTINIETSYFDPVLSVEVSKENVFFVPLIDADWHGAFFEVLKIVYLYEQQMIKEEAKKEKEMPDFDWI